MVKWGNKHKHSRKFTKKWCRLPDPEICKCHVGEYSEQSRPFNGVFRNKGYLAENLAPDADGERAELLPLFNGGGNGVGELDAVSNVGSSGFFY